MNKVGKIGIVVALLVVVAVVVAAKQKGKAPTPKGNAAAQATVKPAEAAQPAAGQKAAIPRMVDLGAGKCIPCKMMAPILEELKKEYAGRLDVVFIDVWENRGAGEKYGINVIPTQIFLDPAGKELFRHEGFFSKEDILKKWKEFGYTFDSKPVSSFERLEPAKPDTRPRDTVCYMCDGDINPKTRVVVQTAKGEVKMCGPHCFFIMYSCLTEDKTGLENKVTVTDWATGKGIPATQAAYLYGLEPGRGRPTIKAFADNETAMKERQTAGGNVIDWKTLQEKELANRCGFCDRAVYPEDAAVVRVGSLSTWGCCSHCALGVAARTGKDIEVHQKDGLTGQMIVVKTLNGSVASKEPASAVAWFGLRKGPDGKFVSAGCFHQGFFTNEENLRKWVEQHPHETGRMISIDQALADKMKLSPQQISKACKIGECAPK
jgi:thioredoxin 1